MASSFKVNNKELPIEPKAATISYMDLDGESERNANGKLIRQIIRRNVVKIELEFPPLYTETASELLNLLDKPEFEFTFPDPSTKTNKTITAYCGDRQLGYLRTGVRQINEPNTFPVKYRQEDLYDGLKVSIIEY